MTTWLDHVKHTMKLNKGKPLKEVLKLAKATYKKTGEVVKYAVTGKKSVRRHKKTAKKSSKKSKTQRRR